MSQSGSAQSNGSPPPLLFPGNDSRKLTAAVLICTILLVTSGCSSSPSMGCAVTLATAPAQVMTGATAVYNAFGIVVNAGGQLLSIYRAGIGHVGDKGDLVLRTSLDGTSWTSPVVLFSDPVYDLRNVAGGMLPSGTIVIFWNRWDLVAQHSAGVFFSRSVDRGLSWSTPVPIDGRDNAYGPIVALESSSGIALSNPFSNGCSVYLHTSSDDGASWKDFLPVASSARPLLHDQEVAIVSVGNGNLLGYARQAEMTPLLFLRSTDWGQSWKITNSTITGTSTENWSLASPWVARVADKGVLWYAERNTGGILHAVLFDGNGRLGTDYIPFAAPTNDFGYPSVTALPGESFLVQFYSRIDSSTVPLYQLSGHYSVTCPVAASGLP